jgi:hypothetical protein
MPASDGSVRGRRARRERDNRGTRASVRRKLRDCQNNPFDVRISASDQQNTYNLNERCRPATAARPPGQNARNGQNGQTERQQIIAELTALGAGIAPIETYASDYQRREPHLNNVNKSKVTAATYASILDGVLFMKHYKVAEPIVHARLNAFLEQWNNQYFSNAPNNSKNAVKVQILQLLV